MPQTHHLRLRARLSVVWAAAAIALPVAIATASPFLSVDLAYQIRLGDLMRNSGSLVRTDVLTFTAAGLPWVDQQWGAQILLSWAFEYGWFGLAVLRSALVAAVLVFQYLGCVARASRRQAAGLTLGSAVLLLGGFQLRPQTFGMACFAALFWLLAGRRSHPNRIWWAVPIVALWANLHGSFVLAPVVVLGAFIEDLADRHPARSILYVSLATSMATLANPFGWRVWRYVWTISATPLIRTSVEEWQPPTVQVYSGALFFLSAIAVAGFLARRREGVPWPTLAWLTAFFGLGLTATRSVFWWGLAAPVVIAGLLARHDKERPDPRSRTILAIICIVVGIPLISLARWYPYRSADSIPPGEFVLYAPAALTQRLRAEIRPGDRFFSPQVWGSWFELALPTNTVPVDSRIEVIPSEAWSDYLAVSQGSRGWQAILERWQVKVAVLEWNQQRLLIPWMKADPGWQLVYEDKDGLILRRP